MMMTIKEAAAYVRVPEGGIKSAAREGRIVATKTQRQPGEGGRGRWLVDKASLERWATDRVLTQRWSEADDAALLELYPTCTDAQLARYLGRTFWAVRNRVTQLSRQGCIELGAKPSNIMPWQIPRSGILLARTCGSCGVFKPAHHFPLKRHTTTRGRCKDCTEDYHRRDPEKGKASMKRLQRLAQDRATRTGTAWTEAEIERLGDVTKSTLELAFELGRTYYAVSSARSLAGVKVRKPRTVHEWLINFTPTNVAERELFRELGVVPESEWEWDDERVSA